MKFLLVNIVLLLSSCFITAEQRTEDEIRLSTNLLLGLNCNACRLMFGASNSKCKVACSTTGGISMPCPTSSGGIKYFKVDGKLYAYVSAAKTWDAAKLNCESLGMHLAYFETWPEFDNVDSSVRDYAGSVFKAWMGMKGSSGTYTFISGAPIPTSVFWLPGADKTKSCGIMEAGDNCYGANSADCTTTLPSVCESETACF